MSEDLKALVQRLRESAWPDGLARVPLEELLGAIETHECGGSAAYLMGSAKAVEQANVSIEKLMAELSRASTERDEARHAVRRLRALLVSADGQIDVANYEPGDITNIHGLKKAIAAALADTKETP